MSCDLHAYSLDPRHTPQRCFFLDGKLNDRSKRAFNLKFESIVACLIASPLFLLTRTQTVQAKFVCLLTDVGGFTGQEERGNHGITPVSNSHTGLHFFFYLCWYALENIMLIITCKPRTMDYRQTSLTVIDRTGHQKAGAPAFCLVANQKP